MKKQSQKQDQKQGQNQGDERPLRLSVRPMRCTDAPAIYRILKDPDVRGPFGLFAKGHFNKNAVKGWCAIAESSNNETTGVDKFYVIRDARRIIGYVGMGQDTDHPERAGRWEVGYFLDPRYQGRGIMSRILGERIKAARETGLVKEFYGAVKHDNEASRQLLEKLGFVRNGVDHKWAPYIIRADGTGEQTAVPKRRMQVFELKA